MTLLATLKLANITKKRGSTTTFVLPYSSYAVEL